jgi:hypothetical protein
MTLEPRLPKGAYLLCPTSMGLALFGERYPGQARWWNFYFPRLLLAFRRNCLTLPGPLAAAPDPRAPHPLPSQSHN